MKFEFEQSSLRLAIQQDKVEKKRLKHQIKDLILVIEEIERREKKRASLITVDRGTVYEVFGSPEND